MKDTSSYSRAELMGTLSQMAGGFEIVVNVVALVGIIMEYLYLPSCNMNSKVTSVVLIDEVRLWELFKDSPFQGITLEKWIMKGTCAFLPLSTIIPSGLDAFVKLHPQVTTLVYLGKVFKEIPECHKKPCPT